MLVELKSLVKRYNDLLAVDHVSLGIKEGAVFGLLGPNGAGKTTILNMLVGLTGIDGGSIRIFGKGLNENGKDVKNQIGVVPQDIAIFEDLTAAENVTFFGKLYGLGGPLLKERFNEALNFVGLEGHSRQFPKKFSGGMKRRLNIACAVVHKPRLIVMDEPTVGIDPQSRNHILESVKALQKNGSTILYTSHYMEEVEELCTRIAIMDQGRVIAEGTKEELKAMISSEERIDVEVTSVNYTLVDEIKKLSGITECSAEEKRLIILSRNSSSIMGPVINIIAQNNVGIVSLNTDKVTLENVFLTLTGKTLRDVS